MKKKEKTELKNKSIQELKRFVTESREQLNNLKIELKMGKLKNVHSPLSKRKDIARAQLMLSQKTYENKEVKNAPNKAS